MLSIKVGDSTVVAFVDKPVFLHNGAVITCDSAVRYNDRSFEWFHNVIINKDSTYVYGDRVLYNGNTAEVFSPLIKMVDGNTVLYTYNFIYDTKKNIGEYYGGGTVSQDYTLLESERGFYYGDTKDFICVDRAELRDTSYMIRSDSLGYNTETEIATFFSKTYIWNEKGEILSADEGVYYTRDERYNFFSDAYIMTDTRELWADDIDYRGDVEDAVMRRNIQIRDEEQKVLAFGDYGLYFGRRGEAMLTEKPSLVSFDAEQGDSLYMRADSMFIFVMDSASIFHPDNRKAAGGETAGQSGRLMDGERPLDAAAPTGKSGSSAVSAEGRAADITGVVSDSTRIVSGTEEITEGMIRDSLDVAAALPDSLAAAQPEAIPDSIATARATVPDSLAMTGVRADSVARSTVPAEEMQEDPAGTTSGTQDDLPGQAPDNIHSPIDPNRAKGMDPGIKPMVAKAFADFRETLRKAGEEMQARTDSLARGAAMPENEEGEEVERVMVAYHNVRIFRSDFQAVSDSMVSFTVDSTMHLYVEPVMWNGENQIKSDEVTIYTLNQEIDRIYFVGGNPVMSSRLDSKHYNQVTGKTIEAFFRDNELYRVDAKRNGITYYYLQDDETQALGGFLTVESGDITFYISERMVDDIVFRTDDVYALYPMTDIPASQEQYLPQFKWEGHRKPALKDVFDRVIRPSRREEYMVIPQPGFPITDKIREYRDNLVGSGEWRDRTDDISQEARDLIISTQKK